MKVLLTRRQADSERTAGKLRKLGLDPVIVPLSELVATGKEPPVEIPDFLMFTSAAAVETAGRGGYSKACKLLPVYCVGPRTAASAENHGYTNIRTGPGTAAGLADLIEKEQGSKPCAGLYACGEIRSYDFAARFQDSAIRLQHWTVYRIGEAETDSAVFKEAVNSLSNGIVMLFSPKSADSLFERIAEPALSNAISKCRIVAISQNCANHVPPAYRKNVRLADHPDEEGMLAAAESIAQQSAKNV